MPQVAILVMSFEHIFFCSFVGICIEQTIFLFNNLCSNLVSFFTCFLAVPTLLGHLLEVMQVIKSVWASLAYLPVFRFRAEVCYLLQDVRKAILYKRRMCSMPPFEISLRFFFSIKTINLGSYHLLFSDSQLANYITENALDQQGRKFKALSSAFVLFELCLRHLLLSSVLYVYFFSGFVTPCYTEQLLCKHSFSSDQCTLSAF